MGNKQIKNRKGRFLKLYSLDLNREKTEWKTEAKNRLKKFAANKNSVYRKRFSINAVMDIWHIAAENILEMVLKAKKMQ